MARHGILIVLSGPSGTGKGTICKELLAQNENLHYSISATTRSARPGEVNGVNYWFVAPDEFRTMVEQDELLEWAEVYGNCYGTPRRWVSDMLWSGHDVVLEIDTQGAMQIKKKFPQGVFVFIIPPSLKELEDRIVKRGADSPAVIAKRLGCVQGELGFATQYDYAVVNDEVATATAKIAAIIVAEKCRMERNSDLIEAIGKRGSID
ncbi:guanylate kinase [Anaeroselena agilis]|uniref:Guanylate kinase n=1 Tax=Anaeroselena agilis TaxID=3063788 RepID=A0ABU3NXH3_9FIRM|nr:guanylate kinase [Selenomonadales bacterium 4137-cl]